MLWLTVLLLFSAPAHGLIEDYDGTRAVHDLIWFIIVMCACDLLITLCGNPWQCYDPSLQLQAPPPGASCLPPSCAFDPDTGAIRVHIVAGDLPSAVKHRASNPSNN